MKTNNKATNPKIFNLVMVFFYGSILAYCFYFIVSSDIKTIIAILPDDSSYYFTIAENFVQGKGFTFDGIHQTNGFQPLWLYSLIIINFFIKGTPELMLRVYLIFQLFLLAAATYLFYRSLNQFVSREALILGSFIYMAYVLFNALNGMESALLVFTISLLLYSWVYIDKFRGDKKIFQVLLGAEIGLMLLTRLDTIFIAVSIFVALLIFRFKWPGLLIQNTLLSLGILSLIIPYLLFNYYSFGRIMPISGAIKSTFPVVEIFEINIFVGFSIFAIAAAALGYLLLIIFHKKIYTTELNALQIFLFAFCLGIILHYLNYLLFMKWGVYNWHFITYYFFISVLICEFYQNKIKHRTQAHLFFNLLLVVAAATFVIRLNAVTHIDLNQNFQVASYQAAKFMAANSDPKDIFAMTDAGVFGYFSQRRVINLDGLVNNFDYQEILRDKKINAYFEAEGVDYYVQHGLWRRGDEAEVLSGEYVSSHVSFYSHLYSTHSDPIVLFKENEVYRSIYFKEPNRTAFLIWKLSPDNSRD